MLVRRSRRSIWNPRRTGAGAFVCRKPRTFHSPIGFGCLGFAVPAAIGGKIARPGVPVVALSGDGGFLFTGQELATAVHERVSVVVVVFNDHAFGTIKPISATAIRRASSAAICGVRTSCDTPKPLARAAGAWRIWPRSRPPADAALAQDGPTLIEAPCAQALPPGIETTETR